MWSISKWFRYSHHSYHSCLPITMSKKTPVMVLTGQLAQLHSLHWEINCPYINSGLMVASNMMLMGGKMAGWLVGIASWLNILQLSSSYTLLDLICLRDN